MIVLVAFLMGTLLGSLRRRSPRVEVVDLSLLGFRRRSR